MEEEKRRLEERFRTEYEYKLYMELQKNAKIREEKENCDQANKNASLISEQKAFSKEYDDLKKEIIGYKEKNSKRNNM